MYNSSIYSININKFQKPANLVQKKENEQEGQNTHQQQEPKEPNYNKVYHPTPGYYNNSNFIKPSFNQISYTNSQQPQQPQAKQSEASSTLMTRQQFPNGEKTAIDYTQSKINISQVIKDFKSTTEAIGSPDDIKETVYTYVGLVKQEAQKEKPNKKLIQSNLKNASQVLDEYITDTLKKPSNVVEGWIDSLFLQNVDYQYDENVINPDYLVKLPEKKSKNLADIKEPEQIPTEGSTPITKEPDRFFVSLVEAKKQENPAEALNMYSAIIKDAQTEGDKRALSIAYFESGKLYDKFNSYDKAIQNYQSAIEMSNDAGLKAQAYMKMAELQHDNSKLNEAGENYFSSIGYFGETENLKAQAVLLSQTGKLTSEQYDKLKSSELFNAADSLALELQDKTLSAKINQKAGEAFTRLNEPKTALDYYRDSSASYQKVENNEELAKNYRAAAKLMVELGNAPKARKLLNKAFKVGLKTDNQDLIKHIQSDIVVLQA